MTTPGCQGLDPKEPYNLKDLILVRVLPVEPQGSKVLKFEFINPQVLFFILA